jgi:FG-GAP repeat
MPGFRWCLGIPFQSGPESSPKGWTGALSWGEFTQVASGGGDPYCRAVTCQWLAPACTAPIGPDRTLRRLASGWIPMISGPVIQLSFVLALLACRTLGPGGAIASADGVEAGLGPKAAAPTSQAVGGSMPRGLDTHDRASICAAYEAGRYAAVASEGGFRARNPAQQWTTHFNGRGFTIAPDAGEWTWGLQLEAYGWGAPEPVAATPASLIADGQHVSCAWDALITEWHVNNQIGLEHGFTLHARPEDAQGALVLEVAIRGALRPRISENGRDVRFVNASGGAVLHYAGLKVFDHDGQALVAGWTAAGERLRLRVEDQLAHYPLTIDPLAQSAYLKASNTEAVDLFGLSVAVSGDTVIVGAANEDSAATGVDGDQGSNASGNSGAAYVFVRSGTTWTQQAYLKASNTEADDGFGSRVAVAGDTVVIGAPREDSAATGSGGDQASNAAPDAGAAYVFVRNGTTWTQQAYLKASNTEAFDWFGISVAIAGDSVVVGARNEDSAAVGINGHQHNNAAVFSGAAYVFVRSGSAWTQQAYLKASNTGVNDQFGHAVAVSGDTLVVTAIDEASAATGVNGDQASNAAVGSGAAYVFVRSGSTWTQQAYLKASNTGVGDDFGWSCALSGDTLVVGASSEDSAAVGVNGDQSNNNAPHSGAAYVFVRDTTTWTQQGYIKASNTGAQDIFGEAVALSGDTLVVGASLEDSGSLGVNGNQRNNNAFNAGAAYIFVRDTTTWTQQGYLKASNTGSNDSFGSALALSGDTLVVGALSEDSAATGVNGNQSSNTAVSSGAAYLFDLDLLTEPWTNLGFGLPGTSGEPLLVGSGAFTAGTTVLFTVSNAAPLAPCILVLGSSMSQLPLLGGVLVPETRVLLELMTNSGGTVQKQVPVSTLLPVGLTLFAQAWILDAGAMFGWAASNAVKATAL